MDGSIKDKQNSGNQSGIGVSRIAMRTIYDYYTKTHYLKNDERTIEEITGIDEATWEDLKNKEGYNPPYEIIKKLLDLGWNRYFLEHGEGALFTQPDDPLDVIEANFHYLRHLYHRGYEDR